MYIGSFGSNLIVVQSVILSLSGVPGPGFFCVISNIHRDS